MVERRQAMKRLEVEWNDSQLRNGAWEPISELLNSRNNVRCRSIGYVLADDKYGLVLAGSLNGDDATGVIATGVIQIPASAIVKRRKV